MNTNEDFQTCTERYIPPQFPAKTGNNELDMALPAMRK